MRTLACLTTTRRLAPTVVLIFGALIACGKSPRKSVISDPGDLGAIDELRAGAVDAGCTVISSPVTPNGFACVKRVKPCGCELVLKVIGTPDAARIAWLKIDLFGCSPDLGRAEVRALVDPLVPSSHVGAFHDFTTNPRILRDADQRQHYAVFQSASFEHVHTRVLFGVVNETPRQTLWLDRYTPGGIELLVPDAPAYASPCVERDVYESQVKRFGKAGADRLTALSEADPLGYCDSANRSEEICELEGGVRSTAIERIHSVITDASLGWTVASTSLRIDERLKAGDLALDPHLGQSLAETLLDRFAIPATRAATSSTTASGPVLSAGELASRTAQLMQVPSDATGYRAFLQTFAAEWADNINSCLSLVSDHDLIRVADTIEHESHDSRARTMSALQQALQPFERH